MSALRTIYVLYDAGCGLCMAIKDWLNGQPKLVGIVLIPAASPEAAELLRGATPPSPDELVVVSDNGWLWRGDHAWVIVLWALRDYRAWARHMAKPALLPLARQAFAALSKNRAALSFCVRPGGRS
jgi:predicted DCC family thiol-disulfide oxidoreductase YuxK